MAAVGLSTCAGRGGISILSQLLHPLTASTRCSPDFYLHRQLVFDRRFVVQKLKVGFLSRVILPQQNLKCCGSGGICRAGDAGENAPEPGPALQVLMSPPSVPGM